MLNNNNYPYRLLLPLVLTLICVNALAHGVDDNTRSFAD